MLVRKIFVHIPTFANFKETTLGRIEQACRTP